MINIDSIDFDKSQGLVPAIIQDSMTNKVLMLGYMDRAALKATIESGLVTFYSRTKKRLWTKGEKSGNHLVLKSIKADCDGDTLLVQAFPKGPVCHTGTDTCWKEKNDSNKVQFLNQLEKVIESRQSESIEKSYTAGLFKRGINKIAQKVGEEAVELVIEAKDNDKQLFLGEAADLIFHFLILLRAKGFNMNDVIEVLEERHSGRN